MTPGQQHAREVAEAIGRGEDPKLVLTDDPTGGKRTLLLERVYEAAKAMRDYYEMDTVPRSEHGIPEQALLKALDDLA